MTIKFTSIILCGILTCLNLSAQSIINTSSNWAIIPAGSFEMGSPLSEIGRYNDENLHKVIISQSFEAQLRVVSQSEYFLIMGSNPSYFKNREFCPNDFIRINNTLLCPNNPVEQVSWDDAQNFIAKLNETDTDYLYRLPTEAELEYVIRAGSQTAYWFGNDASQLGNYAWYSKNSEGMTHAVDSKAVNPWGIYNAHGNVWQWTSDWYGKYSASPLQVDPGGPLQGTYRVIRGGGWYRDAIELRSAFRFYVDPSSHYFSVGFRMVRSRRVSFK